MGRFKPEQFDAKKLLNFSNIDLISKLPIIKVTGGRKRTYYKVKCRNCNKKFLKNQYTFGKYRCQCYKKVNGAYNFQGYKDISAVYFSRVKANAKTKEREFIITKQSIWEQWIKQDKKCALSGVKLVIERNYKKLKIMTASLDRIDSEKGYTNNNIQWVHKHLNQMKSNHSQDYFLKLCRLITNYQNKKLKNDKKTRD